MRGRAHVYVRVCVCVCILVSYPRPGFDVHYAICFKKCAAGICIGAMYFSDHSISPHLFSSISMIPKHTHQSSRVCCLSGILTCKINHLCSLLELIPALDYPIALLFPHHLVVSTFWVLCVTTIYASPYETCTCASPGGTERHTERQMHIPLYRSTCAGRCLVVDAVCRCCRTACTRASV